MEILIEAMKLRRISLRRILFVEILKSAYEQLQNENLIMIN